jgi:GNAT superfamily N-acetyltransferase
VCGLAAAFVRFCRSGENSEAASLFAKLGEAMGQDGWDPRRNERCEAALRATFYFTPAARAGEGASAYRRRPPDVACLDELIRELTSTCITRAAYMVEPLDTRIRNDSAHDHAFVPRRGPSPANVESIRPAEVRDIPRIVEMAASLHAATRFAFLPFDPAKFTRVVAACIQHPERCALVAEHDGALAGMLLGYLGTYPFCEALFAGDIVVFVEPARRGTQAAHGLVGAFRAWAVECGARELCFGVGTEMGAERAGRFYEKLGFAHVGGVYKQRLA